MTATTDLTFAPDDAPEAALAARQAPLPELSPDARDNLHRIAIAVFTGFPMLALLAAVPVAWIWGLIDWQAIVVGIVFYGVSGLGIAMGFHRYFTHGSFKAKRGFKIALAVAGSLAVEGPILDWVSDHRRHHKYSDKD